MGQVPPPLWPPLLLALTLMGAPTAAGIEKVTVQAPSQVHGFVGDTVTLPCKLQSPESNPPKVTQITWMRREPSGELSRVAVFHPVQGSDIPEKDRIEFLAIRQDTDLLNASIIVRELRTQDEANYTCEIATFPRGSGSKRIWLRVLARPENKAESLEVLQSAEPVPVARCISAGGRPPPRVNWVSDLGGKINQSQELLSGTVTVTSVLILTPSSQEDGKTVTCQVEHETQDAPALLHVNLSVLYPPQVSISRFDDTGQQGLRETILTCDARSNPEPKSYNWSTTTGPLPPSAVPQGSRLLIQPTEESINTTFICRVSNDQGTGLADMNIFYSESRMGQSHLVLSIVLPIVVIIVLVAVAAVIYFRCFRTSRQDLHSTSANGTVTYAAVKSEASTT